MRRPLAAALLVVAGGCSSAPLQASSGQESGPASPSGAASSAPPTPGSGPPDPGLGPPAPAGFGNPVTVQVGALPPIRAEVADSPERRAYGLMNRDDVPPGTGMLFRYDAPSTGDYYMYAVRQPLSAAFVRDGRVIHIAEMTPCTAAVPQDCPTYGPGSAAYDMVVETTPGTWNGRARVGDAVTVR